MSSVYYQNVEPAPPAAASRQKEGKPLRNEARSRVGNKSLMKILGASLAGRVVAE